MKIGMIDIAISSAIEKKFTCSTGPCVTFPPLGKNYSLPGFKSSCIANCSRNIDIELNETNLLIDTSWIYIVDEFLSRRGHENWSAMVAITTGGKYIGIEHTCEILHHSWITREMWLARLCREEEIVKLELVYICMLKLQAFCLERDYYYRTINTITLLSLILLYEQFL